MGVWFFRRSGQAPQAVPISVYERFFLGAGPAFDLLLALMSRRSIGMFFRIQNFFATEYLRGPCTGLYSMLRFAASEIAGHADIVPAVFHAQYVDRITHINSK
jgi:hypothetical protein